MCERCSTRLELHADVVFLPVLRPAMVCVQCSELISISEPSELGQCSVRWEPQTLKSLEVQRLEAEKAKLLTKRKLAGGE